MAFQFTLEAVLGYRRSLEEREQRRLESLLARRAALLQQVRQVHDNYRQLQAAIEDTIERQATPAVEIHFALAQQHAMQQQQERLQSDLQALAAEVTKQTGLYRGARQKREVLESLRDAQLRSYRLEQRRREQASLDEMFLLRHARGDEFA